VPGTPHHALGGPVPTAVVATVAASACVAGLFAGLRAGVDRRRLAVGGGVGYAAALLAAWAAVRLLFWRFAGDFSDPGAALSLAVLVGTVVVVLGAQWAAAAVLFATYRTRTAVVWLFAATWVTTYAYLQVGGESGGVFLLLIWALGVGPGLLCTLVALVGGEVVVERVLG
jgi:hypothetical protein